MKKKKQIIFTDLDGTLLDKQTYSYDEVTPGIALIKKHEIPLIFCSAKTRAEQEVFRVKLDINDPFIIENGGAIYIPENYFPFPFEFTKEQKDFLIIELGIPYKRIREVLVKIREETNCEFTGFGDMSVEQVAAATDLTEDLARRAKQREYDETVMFHAPVGEVDKCLAEIKAAGLNYAHGGRFYNVMGPNDKGKAVAILSDLYRRLYDNIETIGLGDSLNDLPMLSAVDTPMLVQQAKDSWETMDLQNLQRIEGIGPAGWNKAITDLLAK